MGKCVFGTHCITIPAVGLSQNAEQDSSETRGNDVILWERGGVVLGLTAVPICAKEDVAKLQGIGMTFRDRHSDWIHKYPSSLAYIRGKGNHL